MTKDQHKQSDPDIATNLNEEGTKDTQTNKKPLTLTLAIVLCVIALAAAAYLYWLYRDSQQALADARRKAETSQASDSKKSAAEDCKEDTKDQEPEADTETDLPVIVFSPGGNFSDAEKTELTTKLLDPFKDWQHDQGQQLVSVHVQQHFATPTEYTVDAIHRDGAHSSFLFGTVDAASQPWWQPTCLDACEFTPEFRARYPGVVSSTP